MRRARVCADLDGGVDGVADDAGVRLPCAEPNRGDLGAGVEHEMPRHRRLSLQRFDSMKHDGCSFNEIEAQVRVSPL